MNRVYNITGQVKDWLLSHTEKLYQDVLEAAELHATTEHGVVTVCTIRSITGVTDYVLSTPEMVVESLRKAEAHFVAAEEYEKAARARDCGSLWQDKALIYRKRNSHTTV